jgi:hypothetical protein
MGIDRTGRTGSPPPPQEIREHSPVAPSSPPFDVKAATPVAQTSGIDAPRTALDRWRTGEIDLHGYIDIKAHEATAHLVGIPPNELDAIRGALRERMATDPALAELVRGATGRLPVLPSDD